MARWTLCLPLAVLIAACGPMEPEEIAIDGLPINRDVSALNGQLTYSGYCHSSDKTRLLAVVAKAKSLLSSSSFEACMKSATISDNRTGWSPEVLLKRLRDNMPTEVKCEYASGADWQGKSRCSSSTTAEAITINTYYLRRWTTAQMAGIMLHEVAHCKGYDDRDDSYEDDYTTVMQLDHCAAIGTPAFVPRDTIANETELSQFGSSKNGTPGEVACGEGAFMYGGGIYYGPAFGKSTPQALKIKMSCRSYWGGSTTNHYLGSSSGYQQYKYGYCPSGYYVVGIYGRSDQGINAMGYICQKPGSTSIAYKNLYPSSYSATTYATRQCPTGMGVSRIIGRTSGGVHQLRLVCRKFEDRVSRSTSTSGRYGVAVGHEQIQRAKGLKPLTGIYGVGGGALNELVRIGGLWTAGSVPGTWNGREAIPAAGGRVFFSSGDASPFFSTCNSGSAIVGFKIRAGSRIDSIQPICVNIYKWRYSKYFTYEYLPARGGSGGSLYTYKCAKGTFVTGFRTWTSWTSGLGSDTIHGLKVYCRKTL